MRCYDACDAAHHDMKDIHRSSIAGHHPDHSSSSTRACRGRIITYSFLVSSRLDRVKLLLINRAEQFRVVSDVSSLFIITDIIARSVAPRASALLLLMHVNNNVSSTHMFNVVLHALSSFIICISSSRSSHRRP